MAASSSSSTSSSTETSKSLTTHAVMVCHRRWRGVFMVEDTMTNRVLKEKVVSFVNKHRIQQKDYIGIERSIDEDSFEFRRATILDTPLKDADLVPGWEFFMPCIVMVMRNEDGDLEPIELAAYAPPAFIPATEYQKLREIAQQEVDADDKGIVIE